MKNITVPVLLLFLFCSCSEDNPAASSPDGIDYRQEMRSFVTELSVWAKSIEPEFAIVPQNGQELATETGDPEGAICSGYLAALDATGREDLLYGYDQDDQPTPAEETDYMRDLCMVFEENGVQVMVTDYCSTHAHVDDSYTGNQSWGFISFAADQRELNSIPGYPAEPWNLNTSNIGSVSQAANFLYLINGENYSSRQDFIDAVAGTSYDIVIMDLFHNGEQFTPEQISQLGTKNGGGERLVLCYMSIGEAEDYRYYWNPSWSSSSPDWLAGENPSWPGNYKVEYWNPAWQAIIYGNDDSYLQRVIDSGFDGVYLDIIDAWEYFEMER